MGVRICVLERNWHETFRKRYVSLIHYFVFAHTIPSVNLLSGTFDHCYSLSLGPACWADEEGPILSAVFTNSSLQILQMMSLSGYLSSSG